MQLSIYMSLKSPVLYQLSYTSQLSASRWYRTNILWIFSPVLRPRKLERQMRYFYIPTTAIGSHRKHTKKEFINNTLAKPMWIGRVGFEPTHPEGTRFTVWRRSPTRPPTSTRDRNWTYDMHRMKMPPCRLATLAYNPPQARLRILTVLLLPE